MKKPKSKNKPAKTPAAKVPENHKIGENCIFDICPDIWLVTPHTIAMIAATLAKNITDKPEVLADTALKLFYASVERVITADDECEIYFRREALNEKLGYNSSLLFDPLNQKYPVTRDAFLNHYFRWSSLKGRTADIAALAKNYLKDTLRDTLQREPTLEEVAEAYQNWKPCQTAREANALVDRFSEWQQQHIKVSRRAAGLKSALKKRQKK